MPKLIIWRAFMVLSLFSNLACSLTPKLKSQLKFQNVNVTGASAFFDIKNEFYIVSDNDNSIYKFSQNQITDKIRIFEGALPSGELELKKVKPDLEASLVMASGSVLLIPSGSKKNRVQGALLNFDSKGNVSPEVQLVDFSGLYFELKEKLKDLNIEGSAIFADKIIFFQRGNSSKSFNAIIELDLSIFSKDLSAKKITSASIKKILPISLGQKEGIPYTFTDAITVGEELYFLAAAEDTDDPVLDGHVSGSILGALDKDYKLLWSKEFSEKIKFEALLLVNKELYLLSDPDDFSIPSELYILGL